MEAGRLDLRTLAQFLVVARAPSMTAAARRMGLTTPAISQLVHKLERETEVVLFERGASGLRLTPAGTILRERAQDLIDREADLLHELAPYKGKLLPKLRIYVPETVSKYVMPAIVSQLEGVVGELEIRSGRSATCQQEFLRGQIDVVISSDVIPGMPGLDRLPICHERFVALAPSGVAPDRRSVECLTRDLPFIRVSRGSPMDETIEAYLAAHRLDPPRGIECSSSAPILELVNGGAGWTISAPLAVAYFRPDPARIAYVPLPEPVPSRDIVLIANSGRLLDVPAMLAATSRAAMQTHTRSWPSHLVGAIDFPPNGF